MKNKNYYLLFLLMVISTFTFGQNLIVTLNNSNTEVFPVADIQSIKFGAEEMILYELNGTANTWSIDDIDNYAFEETVGINEIFQVIQEKLNIYPNPATDKLTVNFESNSSEKITISILDVKGSEVAQIFEGIHNEVTQIEWFVNGQPGTYFCKIKTTTKTITKPIIIQ
ncbi:MAG: T9SS type A sorting domain-containing protein [Crocinitomicaceae bacterium]|nr:T9SS type A sorting domain-containing protein [Crocinitomicaceae bacterium]